MATPLTRRPDSGDDSPITVPAGPAAADVIAGLAAAGIGPSRWPARAGFPGLQFAGLMLGVWVIISPFILAAKFAIATPMYWSNTISGGVLVLLALAGLATLATPRRATR